MLLMTARLSVTNLSPLFSWFYLLCNAILIRVCRFRKRRFEKLVVGNFFENEYRRHAGPDLILTGITSAWSYLFRLKNQVNLINFKCF